MSSVTLSTISVKTDPFAGLTLSGVSYTTVSVQWQNASSSSADFRIVSDDGSISSEDIQVSGSGTGTYTVTGLDLNTTVKLFLERFEVDTYIRQTSSSSGIDYVEATTLTTEISINIGSSSAQLTWQNPGTDSSLTSFQVEYILAGTEEPIFEAPVTDHSALLTGLTQGEGYIYSVSVIEGETTKRIGNFTQFETSSGAAMEITSGPFASYIELDWSASVDSIGTYRIVNRDTDGNDDVLVDSSVITSAVIRDLTPGTSYIFVLQRLELGGDYSDQSQSVVSTPTTNLSVGSVGSQTIEVTWGNLYDGAQFEVMFNGTSAGQTDATSMILRDLVADTNYSVQLNVIELGESLGLSALGITTNQSLIQKLKLPITLPIAVAVLLVVAFMMMKK